MLHAVLSCLLLLVRRLWLLALSQCHIDVCSQHNMHQDYCHHGTDHRAVAKPKDTCARDNHITMTSCTEERVPGPHSLIALRPNFATPDSTFELSTFYNVFSYKEAYDGQKDH